MALSSLFADQVALSSGMDDQSLVGLALVAIAAFVVWLLFFSGNGTIQDFIKDITSRPDRKPKELFPVPQFDKSKLDIPRPPKPARKPLKYKRTVDEINYELDDWAKELRESIKDVRSESRSLVEKYKDVPLKRSKSVAGASTKKSDAKKMTAKIPAKPAAKASKPKPKAKPAAAKKTTKSVKKTATSAKSKATKGKR